LGIINLEDLKVDMLLEDDVVARNGRTLLRAGNRVTEKHIGIFKAWGVTEADIHGITKDEAAAAAVEEIDPKTLQRAQERTEARFRHAGVEHPLLKELLRVCTFRAVNKS
jgi:hypothetical protein